MKQILIATHGKMASGIRYTAELIVGQMAEIETIDAYVTPEDNVEEKFKEYFQKHEQDRVIVFTDLMGGSVNQKLMEYSKKENVTLITGTNLPMLMQVMLADDDVTDEEIQETIDWLQEKHFLREEDGCQRRFEHMYQNTVYSLRQIVVKLRQQGYDKDLVQSFVPDDTTEREYKAAYKVISRKFKPGADKQKIYQHLCMKGFDYDVARNAVEDLLYTWEKEADE